jgi:hypothetical protein
MQRPSRHHAAVERGDPLGGPGAQPADQLVRAHHALDEPSRHHAIGAHPQEDVAAVDEPVGREMITDHRGHRRRRERRLDDDERYVSGRLLPQRPRQRMERGEQWSVVGSGAVTIGLHADDDQVSVATMCVVVGRRQGAACDRIGGDVVQVGLDTANGRSSRVDRVDLPPRRGRSPLDDDDAAAPLSNRRRRQRKERGHRHADDSGADDDNLFLGDGPAGDLAKRSEGASTRHAAPAVEGAGRAGRSSSASSVRIERACTLMGTRV